MQLPLETILMSLKIKCTSEINKKICCECVMCNSIFILLLASNVKDVSIYGLIVKLQFSHFQLHFLCSKHQKKDYDERAFDRFRSSKNK